jgi:hypothetical protein
VRLVQQLALGMAEQRVSAAWVVGLLVWRWMEVGVVAVQGLLLLLQQVVVVG